MMSRIKSGDIENLKDQLLAVMRKIQLDLDTLKEESHKQREDINKILQSTNKMDRHVDFVHSVYEMLRSPLHLLITLSNKVTDRMDSIEIPRVPPSLLEN